MDLNEAEKFDNQAETWWNPASPMIPLLHMNQVRIPFLIKGLKRSGALKTVDDNDKKPLNGLSILDVGCGCGYLTESLSRLGAKVTGIDGVPKVIEVARAHAALDKQIKDLTYVAESIQEYSAKNENKFDVVIISEVLEHIVDKDEALQCVVRCVKPGGSIIISTESKTFWSKFFVIYMYEYVLRKVPIGTHDGNLFIKPEDTQKLLEKYNCTVTDVRGTFYNPLTGRWFFVPFKTCYIMHAIKN